MNIDLKGKTVAFTDGETLTLRDLVLLVEILDDEYYEDLEPDPWPDEAYDTPVMAVELKRIFHVMSETTLKVYVVAALSHGEWACSCPDWTYRKSLNGGWCKHIESVYWNL